MILKKQKIIEYLIMLLIIFLAFTNVFVFRTSNFSISIYIFYGSYFILFVSLLKFKAPPLNKSFPFLILLYILFSSLLNLEDLRVTSVIYSFLFIAYYIYLISFSKKNLSKEKFIWVLKFIIISFFIVLLLSQFIVLFNLQELKSPKGYFQSSGQLGILFDKRTNIFRYHSLSSEPSYASIIVFLSFTVLNDLVKTKRSLIWYGLLVLYMLLSFKSSMGFLILCIWLISQITFSKKHFIILGIIVFVGTILFFFTSIGGKSVDRLREIVFLLFSFNGNFLEKLNLLDSSVYARIGPLIVYLQGVDIFNFHTYFGYGASTSEAFFSKLIYPEVWNTHMVFKPPFFPGFLYDYGLFGVLAIFYLIWSIVKHERFFLKIVCIIIMLNSNFNTQLFWFVVTLITLKGIFGVSKNTMKVPKVENEIRI